MSFTEVLGAIALGVGAALFSYFVMVLLLVIWGLLRREPSE